ncbi:hypothetical protein BZM26_36925 [Paraburkholderia strydomiana]|nr:hypothetical protein BZM26_36925 [Paraburkholderia strydomiana]
MWLSSYAVLEVSEYGRIMTKKLAAPRPDDLIPRRVSDHRSFRFASAIVSAYTGSADATQQQPRRAAFARSMQSSPRPTSRVTLLPYLSLILIDTASLARRDAPRPGFTSTVLPHETVR